MLENLFGRYMAPEGEGDGGGGSGDGDGDKGAAGEGDGDKGDKGDGDTGKKTIMGQGEGDGGKGGEGDGEAGAWAWGENAPGTGTIPPWFKADKYKTVSDQAQAATSLAEKLGPAAELIGAPEGDYVLPDFPEGVDGEWDTDDPMLGTFRTVAKELGLSQGAHDSIVQAMGALLAKEQGEAETAISDAISAIGTNAPQRIAEVETFLRSSIGDEGYESLEGAIGTDVKAYLALEALVGKAGGDAQLSSLPGKQGPGFTKSDIEAEQYKKFPEDHKLAGQVMYEVDKEHRAKVDGMWKELYPGEDRQQVG